MHYRQQGFTIIEITIVVVIMGILLTLGVVNLTGAQVTARDNQRETNMRTLATNLEKFYTSGLQGSDAPLNRYPPTLITGSSTSPMTPDDELSYLPDLGSKDQNGKLNVLIDPKDSTNGSSLMAATSNNQTTPAPLPSSGNFIYVYQPLQANGNLCTTELQECVKFNLFYYKETTNTVEKITSRHQ